jgi:hypothetical protein
MTKMFQFEDLGCNREIFECFFAMQGKLKQRIGSYLKELVTFQHEVGDPIGEEEQQKFVFHSMALNLEDVRVLYDFFKDYMEEFGPSKQSIKNLCQK